MCTEHFIRVKTSLMLKLRHLWVGKEMNEEKAFLGIYLFYDQISNGVSHDTNCEVCLFGSKENKIIKVDLIKVLLSLPSFSRNIFLMRKWMDADGAAPAS